MNILKRLFTKKNKSSNDLSHSVMQNITCGMRDKNGFADTYVNGNKTNVRLLLFDKEEVEKLQKIGAEIHNKSNNK